MKNFLILALTIFLTGCGAKYPLTTNLNLQVGSQTPGIYSNGTSAALKGHDARQESDVIVYRLEGKPEIKIPNQTPPHLLVTEQLAIGLQEQGLLFESNSPVRIQLNLNELLVSVTRPKLLYLANAKSKLTLAVKNREITLTKIFSRETNRDSATRPPVEDLVKMLNDQLTEIIEQILKDEEVQAIISKK